MILSITKCQSAQLHQHNETQRGHTQCNNNLNATLSTLEECFFAECHYTECRHAEYHYAEFRYAECRGTQIAFYDFAMTFHQRDKTFFSPSTPAKQNKLECLFQVNF